MLYQSIFVLHDTLIFFQFKSLYAVGGGSLNETLSKLLNRLASNEVWSLYSLKGRSSGKRSLIDSSQRIYKILKCKFSFLQRKVSNNDRFTLVLTN